MTNAQITKMYMEGKVPSEKQFNELSNGNPLGGTSVELMLENPQLEYMKSQLRIRYMEKLKQYAK